MDPNNQTTPQVRPAGEGSVGPVVGAIIVLAVIVLGGLYFWGEHTGNNAPYTTPTATSTDATDTTSSSTNINVDTGIQYHGS